MGRVAASFLAEVATGRVPAGRTSPVIAAGSRHTASPALSVKYSRDSDGSQRVAVGPQGVEVGVGVHRAGGRRCGSRALLARQLP